MVSRGRIDIHRKLRTHESQRRNRNEASPGSRCTGRPRRARLGRHRIGRANALTLCVNPGGNVKAAANCKQNETEFKVVSEADFNALEARVDTLEGQVSTLEALLAGVSRANDTLLFSGMNLQVVDGSGLTNNPGSGLGNVIIGYNLDDTRTGTHNLVIGDGHTYTRSGVVSVSTTT